MDDFQKGVLALLVIIAIIVSYGQFYTPVTKAPLFSTQAGSFNDYISIKNSLNISNLTNYFNGDRGSSVSTNFYKGVIEEMRFDTRGTNATVVVLDAWNNATVFTFGYTNGTNVSRNLGIVMYGNLNFNVTGGRNAVNGSFAYVEVIYRGA